MEPSSRHRAAARGADAAPRRGRWPAWPPPSLRMRLFVAGALPLALGALVAVAVLLAQGDDRGVHALAEFERTSAERLARQLDGRIAALQHGLQAAVRSARSELAQPAQAREFLDGQSVLMTMFTSLAVAAPDGRVLALRDGEGVRAVNANVSTSPYFRRTLVQRRAQVSTPLLSRVTGAPLVAFSMPVAGADGEVTAVVIGTLYIGAADMAETLSYGVGAPGESARTIIADATGRIIAHPSAARVMQGLDSEPGLATLGRDWLREGSPAQAQARTHHEPGRLISTASVPTAHWMVFRIADDLAFLEQQGHLRRHAMAWALAALLAGALLSWWAVRRLLQPLQALAGEARALLLQPPEPALPAPAGPPGPPAAAAEAEPETRRHPLAVVQAALARLQAERAAWRQQAADLHGAAGAAMNAVGAGLAFTRDDVFVLVNAEWAALLGYGADELVHQPLHRLCAAEHDGEAMASRLRQAFARGHVFTDELPLRRRDGSVLWARVQARAVGAGQDSPAGVVWTLVEARAAAAPPPPQSQALDPVDKPAYERSFEHRMAQRPPPLPLALLFVDVDQLARLNAVSGRAAGDAVLLAVQRAIEAHRRGDDTLARVGGDEFVLLLSRCDRHQALRIAHQVRHAVQAASVAWMGARLQATCSIGVVEVNDATVSATAVLAAADAACYEAKRAGRHAVHEARPLGLRLVHGGRDDLPRSDLRADS